MLEMKTESIKMAGLQSKLQKKKDCDMKYNVIPLIRKEEKNKQKDEETDCDAFVVVRSARIYTRRRMKRLIAMQSLSYQARESAKSEG